MLNPLEKLNKANDTYHEAVDDILKDDIPVAAKTDFAAAEKIVFEWMIKARKAVEEHYE